MTVTTDPIVLDVAVPNRDLGYPVVVGPGVLHRVGSHIKRELPRASTVAVISDDHVMPLYEGLVRGALEAQGLRVVSAFVPAGEASKTVERMVGLIETLMAAGLGRNDVVVALGGGVVGDLAGLVAALFMRGIEFVQCPTSLLAQVDASVGGKVAVDLRHGKNLLGAFHFPKAVLIDPLVLQTLPDDELGCGLAEMLKHGALFSRAHVDRLLHHAESLYAREPARLAELVAESVQFKAACVGRDPLERSLDGGRVLLNLGHTVGHAIEAASAFGLKHGQAVALGLRAAARLSTRLGIGAADLEDEIVRALLRLRLPIDLDPWLTGELGESVARMLVHDKKRTSKAVTFVVLAALGEPMTRQVPVDEILPLLRS